MPIKYIFGKNIAKQKPNLKYDGYNIVNYGYELLDYNSNDYIAAVNMELSEEDESIVNYYYGPSSPFILNWNENNCSL